MKYDLTLRELTEANSMALQFEIMTAWEISEKLKISIFLAIVFSLHRFSDALSPVKAIYSHLHHPVIRLGHLSLIGHSKHKRARCQSVRYEL